VEGIDAPGGLSWWGGYPGWGGYGVKRLGEKKVSDQAISVLPKGRQGAGNLVKEGILYVSGGRGRTR